MERALWFWILIFILNAVNTQARRTPLKHKSGRRIIGGVAVSIIDYPWQVGLFERGNFFCGGSILSDYFVLTAAHCIVNRNKQALFVKYGTSRIHAREGLVIAVSAVHDHPGYPGKIKAYDNDISILQLYSAIQFSDVARQVTLSKDIPNGGEIATVSGWGSTLNLNGPDAVDLKAVSTKIIDWQTCNKISDLGRYLTQNMICATNKVGFCTGDSGGPLMMNYKQVGIVSFLARGQCADTSFPGVYTSVAQYKDFIDYVTQNAAYWE